MTKRTIPWVGVNHPDFQWKTGSDVQTLWRKYGWVPPSELKPPPPPPPKEDEEPSFLSLVAVRRVK